MKCDLCKKKPAIIFVQQITKNETIELHLCETCAVQKGFSLKNNKVDISLKGLFTEILEHGNKKDKKENYCPNCGTAKKQVKKNGLVGCAKCYQYFSNEINAFLQTEGLEFNYTGILPQKPKESELSNKEPFFLKQQLEAAVEREDYELAAYYRDQLKKMET